MSGLEGVIVAETELSDVDGERGLLILRGWFIEDLVGRHTFEDVCALLWTGRLPESGERQRWQLRLGQARREASDLVPRLTCWAMKPPATEPPSMPAPVTIWPRPKTVSSRPR